MLVLVGVLAVPTSSFAQSTASCQYVLGFQTLFSLAPAEVGTCTDNQAFAPNGDAQQHTTSGLLAWRKADNWTAFTNGDRTWINGPAGLKVRANWQRLPFEANPDGFLWPPDLYTTSHWASEISNMKGQTVDWKTDKTSFHATVVLAVRADHAPSLVYPDGRVAQAAILAPGDGAFVFVRLRVTNTGSTTDEVRDYDVSVKDDQDRTFTYDQTPSDVRYHIDNMFQLRGPLDPLGPALTDDFVLGYVVARTATGLHVVATKPQ